MKTFGAFEPRLYDSMFMLYLPSTGTDSAGKGVGPAWTRDVAQGTVSHPALSAGFKTQFPRTRITSTAAADNELGVRNVNAWFWRGNSDTTPAGDYPDQYRGGFLFIARFMVNAIPNDAVRFFAGVTAQTGTGVCLSNTLPNNTMGLWLDTTHGGFLKLATRDNAGGETKAVYGSGSGVPLTAGTFYEFRLIVNPNQNVIVTQLYDLYFTEVSGGDTEVKRELLVSQNASANLPSATVFLAPQVGLSNAANAGGGDTSLDIVSIYARPNLRLQAGEPV